MYTTFFKIGFNFFYYTPIKKEEIIEHVTFLNRIPFKFSTIFSENESGDKNEEQENDKKEKPSSSLVEKCSVHSEMTIVEPMNNENVATSTKKLNRISDEFFSADDDDDDDDCEGTRTVPSKQLEFSHINCYDEFKLSNEIELNVQTSSKVFQDKNSSDNSVVEKSELSTCSNLNNRTNNKPNDSSPNSSYSKEDNITLDNQFDELKSSDNDNNENGTYNDNANLNDPNVSHKTEENNSELYSDRVQLIDEIERNDFEDEQKAIGTTLMKQKKLICEQKRLNLEMLKIISQYENNRSENTICKKNIEKSGNTTDDDSEESLSTTNATLSTASNKNLSATPTSSRKRMNDRNSVKSISKINFSENLLDYSSVDNENNSNNSINNSINKSDKLSTSNRNLSKSLSSDKSCQTPSFLDEDAFDSAKQECINLQYDECRNNVASTSKSYSDGNDCQYTSGVINKTKTSSPIVKPSDYNNIKTEQDIDDVPEENNKILENLPRDNMLDYRQSIENNNKDRVPFPPIDIEGGNITDGNLNQSTLQMIAGHDQNHDYDEDNWVDCEDVYDMEEICTCQDYSDEDAHASSEDELPSRDVDLSCYTHLDSISEDILHEGNTETPRNYRKRKITETKTFCDGSNDVTSANRKRLALESVTIRKLCTPTITSPSSITSSAVSEKRTPRSIIPTRDNPPPELSDWLLQFQRWSHVERLVAVDRLIEHCEPTQVRYMMKVIEPQFQRDFISLLPKELALQVLSYLEPKDLLRAAQTCRSWR